MDVTDAWKIRIQMQQVSRRRLVHINETSESSDIYYPPAARLLKQTNSKIYGIEAKMIIAI